jgi:hypothetical protein
LEFATLRLPLRGSRAGSAFWAAHLAATLFRLFLMIVVTIAISSLASPTRTLAVASGPI